MYSSQEPAEIQGTGLIYLVDVSEDLGLELQEHIETMLQTQWGCG